MLAISVIFLWIYWLEDCILLSLFLLLFLDNLKRRAIEERERQVCAHYCITIFFTQLLILAVCKYFTAL